MQGNLLLLILVLFPMAAALLGYLIGRRSKRARDVFVMVCGVAELLALLALSWATVGQTLTFSCSGSCALGIRLVMAMCDTIRYTYSLNLNNLTLEFTDSGDSQSFTDRESAFPGTGIS